MLNRIIICLVFVFLFLQGYAKSDSPDVVTAGTKPQDSTNVIPPAEAESKTVPNKKKSIYFIKPGINIPIIAVGTGFSLYAFTVIYDKPPSTETEINNLNVSDINSFDRWSIHPYTSDLHLASSIMFNAAIPLPMIVFLFKKETRQDYWDLTFLYWEALSITGLFGAGAPYVIDRYRPYTYTSETPMEKRVTPNAKNSAFSGHVEMVATSAFFIAKVYSDYYPETKLISFGLASVATGSMAYLRLVQGMHFPSDVLIGATIGTLSGILVPHFHKYKLIKNADLSIIPFSNFKANGLTLGVYKLK